MCDMFYYLQLPLFAYVYDLIELSETITASSTPLHVFMTFVWNNVTNTDWDVTDSHVYAGV